MKGFTRQLAECRLLQRGGICQRIEFPGVCATMACAMREEKMKTLVGGWAMGRLSLVPWLGTCNWLSISHIMEWLNPRYPCDAVIMFRN